MTFRRHLWLTREGAYYLFVLTFVLIGAVLREVNLLMMLAAVMVGPLLFSWRLVAVSLRRLVVTRSLPARISAGDPLTVDLFVANERSRLPSWALILRDEIRCIDSPLGDDFTAAETFIPMVRAGELAVASYRCQFTRRGHYRWERLTVSTQFPLGFVRGWFSQSELQTLIVCPQLGALTQSWHELLESVQTGNQRSQRRRGLLEGDYYGVREWRSGDSRHLIHWRTSAKVGGLAVLQFEQQRNCDLTLVLDLWQPTHSTDEQKSCVEQVVSFGATVVADLCQHGNHRLSLTVLGERISHWDGATSKLLGQALLEQLAVVRGGKCGDSPESLATLHKTIRSDMGVVVISTRPEQTSVKAALAGSGSETNLGPSASLKMWVDVSQKESERLFVPRYQSN